MSDKRGFASLPQDKREEIGRKGGQSSHGTGQHQTQAEDEVLGLDEEMTTEEDVITTTDEDTQ
jgi:hypothetical protein